jgi:anthranilate phosphoribosyltransferase
VLKPYLAKLTQHQDLTAAEAEAAMDIIMTGQATPAQIGAYLMGLRMKGETVAEITGSARSMRNAAYPVNVPPNGHPLLDTAGTGGDGAHTFNISTASAFVIAGAGRQVAKHGNRAASSRCGSADVLAVLGLSLDLTPEQVAACIQHVGIGFMFAPRFHPSMKYAGGVRREMGQRTIFNLLGPLTNPACVGHQLIGVYDPTLTAPLAEVLGALGGQAAFVVHGYGGLDELTTGGPNTISHLKDGRVTTFRLDTAKLGLRPATSADLGGGEPEENARMLRALLAGEDHSPRRDVVLLNAAAALAVDDGDVARGLAQAEVALQSGAALRKLDELIAFSRAMAAEAQSTVVAQ